MKPSEVLMLVAFALGLGLGNILLKLSVQHQALAANSNWVARILSLFTNWAFLIGVALYGLMTLYWIWLLTFIPLSRAYPFTFLSLLVVAIGSFLLFKESITIKYAIGLLLIGLGLAVLSKG